MADDVTIAFHPDEHAFVARVDDARVGLLVDHLRRGRHLLVHTEVAEEHGGKGIAGQLVQFAVDAAREADERIVPICPYVARWFEKHPDQRDVVDEELTAELTDDTDTDDTDDE